MHGGPQLSRQKKKRHNKKNKTFSLCRAVFSFCREVFSFAVRFFLLTWGFFFCREIFSFDVRFFPFAMSLFLFSVRFFLFPRVFFFWPRGYFFCRGVITYAVTVKGHCTNVRPNEAWEAEEKIKESSPKKKHIPEYQTVHIYWFICMAPSERSGWNNFPKCYYTPSRVLKAYMFLRTKLKKLRACRLFFFKFFFSIYYTYICNYTII